MRPARPLRAVHRRVVHRCAARSLAALLLVPAGCFAPVQWSGPAREPPRTNYAGPHGVPLAYGGGVCPLESLHSHGYPPVPAAAFVKADGGLRDTRTLYPFYDAHPHEGRTCFREGLHLHLEPPGEGVRFDAARDAWMAAR